MDKKERKRKSLKRMSRVFWSAGIFLVFYAVGILLGASQRAAQDEPAEEISSDVQGATVLGDKYIISDPQSSMPEIAVIPIDYNKNLNLAENSVNVSYWDAQRLSVVYYGPSEEKQYSYEKCSVYSIRTESERRADSLKNDYDTVILSDRQEWDIWEYWTIICQDDDFLRTEFVSVREVKDGLCFIVTFSCYQERPNTEMLNELESISFVTGDFEDLEAAGPDMPRLIGNDDLQLGFYMKENFTCYGWYTENIYIAVDSSSTEAPAGMYVFSIVSDVNGFEPNFYNYWYDEISVEEEMTFEVAGKEIDCVTLQCKKLDTNFILYYFVTEINGEFIAIEYDNEYMADLLPSPEAEEVIQAALEMFFANEIDSGALLWEESAAGEIILTDPETDKDILTASDWLWEGYRLSDTWLYRFYTDHTYRAVSAIGITDSYGTYDFDGSTLCLYDENGEMYDYLQYDGTRFTSSVRRVYTGDDYVDESGVYHEKPSREGTLERPSEDYEWLQIVE